MQKRRAAKDSLAGTIRHGLGLQHESQPISRWLRFGSALRRRSDNRRYELGRIKTEGLF